MKAYLLRDNDNDITAVILASDKFKAWQAVYEEEQKIMTDMKLTRADLREHYSLERVYYIEAK